MFHAFVLQLPVILAASLCSAQQQSTDEDRDVSWKKLVPNIVEDQKAIWLFPRKLDKPRDFIPSAAFIVTGAALVVGADPPVAHYFRNTTAFNGFNRAMPERGHFRSHPGCSDRAIRHWPPSQRYKNDEDGAAYRRGGCRCRNPDGGFQACGLALAPEFTGARRQFCRHVRGGRQPVFVGP